MNILSVKIRANVIDLVEAERFDSFSSVIFNCILASFLRVLVHNKDEKRIFLTVSNKLKRLSIDLGLEMKDEPQVVFNRKL